MVSELKFAPDWFDSFKNPTISDPPLPLVIVRKIIIGH